MNKQGYKGDYKISKEIVVGVLTLVIALVIFSYIANPNFMYSIKKSLQNIDFDLPSAEKVIDCPNDVIPSFINLQKEGNLYFLRGGITLRESKTNFWYDGTPMKKFIGDYYKFGEAVCRKGAEKGENINYFYCYNLTYDKSETEFSDDGVVGETKTTKMFIDLVLRETGTQDFYREGIYGEQIYEYTRGNYQVVFSTCKTVKEFANNELFCNLDDICSLNP